MSSMTDAHRLFLQSFMSKGNIDAKQVKELFKLSRRRFNGGEECSLVDFVGVINENIKPIHLELKKAVSEDTGKQSYCLVSTIDSDFTKLASSNYNATQLDVFKRLVEKIAEAENGTVSSIEALHLPDLDPPIKMSKKDTEALFDKLERQNWIKKNLDGQYFLTARSVLELEHYIRGQYPNLVIICNICNKLVLQGQNCVNCDVKLHIGCAKDYFGKLPPNTVPKCPGSQCNAPWSHAIPRKDGNVAASQAASPDRSQRETRKRKARDN